MIPDSIPLLIAVNAGAWVTVQMALAWSFTRMPTRWFHGGSLYAWETGGRIYEQYAGVKAWKALLPDGASWFAGGIPKRTLTGRSPAVLKQFVTESIRGEITHWCAIAVTPVFLFWNPLWALPLHLAYAIAANLPCIIVQRYNRARLLRALRTLSSHCAITREMPI